MSATAGLGLFFQVLWAVVVTHFICIRELFHFFIWSRRQKSVKDKVVVVTGTGHGLGRRIARDFARLGATVVCWDVDRERNENTVWDIKHTNGKAVAVTCDVTDRTLVFKTVEDIVQQVGPIDIFVSGVGIYPVKDILSWTPDELYELFDINVMAQFWLMQAVVPRMKARQQGHFVAISSAAAIAPVPNEVPYSITKCAVSGLMEGFIQELKLDGQSGIKVTTVHPYYTACRTDIPVKFDLRLLPQDARSRWRDIFYTRVFPTEVSASNIIERYKLPPLGQVNGTKSPTNGTKLRDVLLGVKVEPHIVSEETAKMDCNSNEDSTITVPM